MACGNGNIRNIIYKKKKKKKKKKAFFTHFGNLMGHFSTL
jgi:hypothetical protein